MSRISSRQIPLAAVLVVSGLSTILVLFFVGQIGVISSLVNFGALGGFMLLHVSFVVHYLVRKRSKNYLLHLVVPVIGFLIIGYVLLNASAEAKVGGVIWLALGMIVFFIFWARGRTSSSPITEVPITEVPPTDASTVGVPTTSHVPASAPVPAPAFAPASAPTPPPAPTAGAKTGSDAPAADETD